MSSILYTVDRAGTLSQGQELLLNIPELACTYCVNAVNLYHPSGMSKHGCNYLKHMLDWNHHADRNKQGVSTHLNDVGLFNDPQLMVDKLSSESNTQCRIEYILEFVRCTSYPEMPSRFQAVFVVSSIHDARIFYKKCPSYCGISNNTVYEICSTAEPIYTFDMSLLNPFPEACRFQDMVERAKNYWSRCMTNDPLWETLLVLPVEVGRRISTAN